MRGLAVFAIVIASACNAVFDISDTKLRPPDVAVLTPRTLVFNNSGSQIDLVDIPVLVPLDAARIEYASVANPSTDLRFEMDGVDLPFEVETWDPSGDSFVWVRVPKITAGSRSDRMLMHYGSDAAGNELPTDVWTGYEFVSHGEGDFHSSVGEFPVTVSGNASREIGQAGGAMHFTGAPTDRIVYANATSLVNAWPAYTLDYWIYADYASALLGTDTTGTAYEPRFFEKAGAFTLGRLLQTGNQYLFKIQIDTHYQTTSYYRTVFLPPRRWIHVVQTYDGTTQFIYRNAIVVDYIANTSPGPTAAGQSSLVLGGNQNVLSLIGMLDEIRITRQVLSPERIEAEYNMMTGAFVTSFLPGEAPP